MQFLLKFLIAAQCFVFRSLHTSQSSNDTQRSSTSIIVQLKLPKEVKLEHDSCRMSGNITSFQPGTIFVYTSHEINSKSFLKRLSCLYKDKENIGVRASSTQSKSLFTRCLTYGHTMGKTSDSQDSSVWVFTSCSWQGADAISCSRVLHVGQKLSK